MSQKIITTDTPVKPSKDLEQHTLSVYTHNKPGALMRITQVFSRRSFNIDSLVVSTTRDERYSRMTIGVTGSSNGLEQIILQVSKLIDVLHCHQHTEENSVVKELLLIKFYCDNDQRAVALQYIDHYGAKGVDLTAKSMTVMITGDSDKIESAVNIFSQFEIIETVRTGKVVMVRGDQET
ncbi:acetolactate synthase small subunit [Akkermansiaceae bacterium]|nr:acetolactate synthase small subunit [Akkermansiaceae bacterium]